MFRRRDGVSPIGEKSLIRLLGPVKNWGEQGFAMRPKILSRKSRKEQKESKSSVLLSGKKISLVNVTLPFKNRSKLDPFSGVYFPLELRLAEQSKDISEYV